MEDNQFKQMITENYSGTDIYELWNTYVIMRNHSIEGKTKRCNGARESELEAEVLMELMRKIPVSIKRDFYNRFLDEYIKLKDDFNNLMKACETLDSLEFFKNEILNKDN